MSMNPVSSRAVFFDWMTEDLFLEISYDASGHGAPGPASGLTQRASILAPHADASRISSAASVMTPFLQDFAISLQSGVGARSGWWTSEYVPPNSAQTMHTPPPIEVQTPQLGAAATPPGVTAALVNKLNNADVDALLWGYKWNTTSLTYSFPTSADEYTGYASIVGFQEFNAAQKIFTQRALANIASFSGLTFTEDAAGGDPAVLRFAEATSINYTDDPLVAGYTGLHVVGSSGTAEASPPALAYNGSPPLTPAYSQGDGWHTPGKYENPVPGTFAFAAGIMHELGHNLGLKHGHDGHTMHGVTFPALPSDHDSQEYSIMTYRESPGSNLGSIYAINLPTTYMMDDIAALQYLYGANYSHRSTATTYSWDPTNGSFVIFDNTGAQGTTPNANVVFMTIWDGGGTDTYDFSNYTTNLKVSLVPGGYTNLGGQLANLGNDTPGNVTVFARGNIFNALQDPNNPTEILSLIENAIGGTGNDEIVGNIVANTLTGGGGNDQITGGAGNDTMYGGTGNDVFLAITGVDTANGDGGDDAIYFTSVDGGVYDGGTGNDTVSFFGDANVYGDYDLSAPSFTTAFGGTFSNFENIIGSDNAETLIGSNADNSLSGAGGNDNINGGLGNDQLFGGEGDDVVFADGGDTMKGAGGEDVLVLSSIAAAGYFDGEFGSDTVVFTSLAAMVATYDLSIANFTTPLGGTFQGFENIRGTGGAETMLGNDVANRLEGGGGNDVLYGRDGDDTLIGGAGTDQMFGQGGNDTYIEPIGDGVYEAADQGDDTVEISATYSIAALPNIENISLKGTGNFNATGNVARNRLTGNSGASFIYELLNEGTDTIRSDTTFDISTQANFENIELTGLASINATGNTLANRLTGNAGNNTLSGGAGNDTLSGGEGNDRSEGGLDADTYLFAFFTGGADTIFETGGADTLNATDSSVTTLSFRRSGTSLIIERSGAAGRVTIEDHFGAAGSRVDYLQTLGGYHSLKTNLIGTGSSEIFVGLSTADTIDSLGGNDLIFAGAGNDTVTGGAGNDIVFGGQGSDRYRFTFSTSQQDTISERDGNGTDTLLITDLSISELTFRRSGSLLIAEAPSQPSGKLIIQDHFSGIATNRIEIIQTTDGARFFKTGLIGTATDDIVVGSSVAQTLEGRAGKDVLVGSGGKDMLFGGTGADIFVFSAVSDSTVVATGRDTIYDFSQIEGDRMSLLGIDANLGLAGDNAFTFLGLGATAGAGTLAYSIVAGNTLIQGDLDGGGADFAILLAGNVTLTQFDFYL